MRANGGGDISALEEGEAMEELSAIGVTFPVIQFYFIIASSTLCTGQRHHPEAAVLLQFLATTSSSWTSRTYVFSLRRGRSVLLSSRALSSTAEAPTGDPVNFPSVRRPPRTTMLSPTTTPTSPGWLRLLPTTEGPDGRFHSTPIWSMPPTPSSSTSTSRYSLRRWLRPIC